MMMLLKLAKRLPIINPQLSLPLALQSFSLTSSNNIYGQFSQAFHRTLGVPSLYYYLRPPQFTTLHAFSTQYLNDPFEFSSNRFKTIDTHNPIILQFIELLKQAAKLSTEEDIVSYLEEKGTEVNRDIVFSAIWALRDQWKVAFLALKWGEKWDCVDEEVCNLMIWVLGNHKKFNNAWCLIRDLHRSSIDIRLAMFTMIDRYANANDPCEAIRTFHIMEKFSLIPDQESYHVLLNTLCKYEYIEEAEDFMLGNKKLFPLQAESFNIILNGWCNIVVDMVEAKRIWREMSAQCVIPDATSYTHMISCFSKVGNLFDSLRLYDEMKKRGWVPGVKVYNSLIYVLTSSNCLNEALKILDKMKDLGLQPDSITYNSIICPLCEAKKLEEARKALSAMFGENLSPTTETYHAFLESEGFEGTLGVLSDMKKANLGPSGETFLIILRRFLKSEQPENAIKIWTEMKKYEVTSDSIHYTEMVKGLVTCGLLDKAREFFAEMTSKGYLGDPKLHSLLKATAQQSIQSKRENSKCNQMRGKMKKPPKNKRHKF